MSDKNNKIVNQALRSKRVRAGIKNQSSRPRLSVKISNKNVSAQIIDDKKGSTLVSATSIGTKQTGNLVTKAAFVGETIAKEAQKKKIKFVVFDRGSKQYHGRVKALAEAARKNGLEF